jgi:uncharacterized membrane protein YfcA
MGDPSFLLSLLLIGFITGLVTGVTGSSGVAVIVPLLALFLGVQVHEAIGVSLMVDIIASAVIAFTYYQHDHLRLGSGIWIGAGSVLGAQVGAVFAQYIPENNLGALFGLFMLLTGAIMWRRRTGTSGLSERLGLDHLLAEIQLLPDIPVAVTLGFVIGIGTGLIGAGGGLMILLVLVFVMNFELHVAVGTSTLIMALTASSGAIGYAMQDSVEVWDGLVAGGGAALGGMLSALLANHVAESALNRIISLFFLSFGLVMSIVYFLG